MYENRHEKSKKKIREEEIIVKLKNDSIEKTRSK
jgi:hypothetical protein